jgi:DNA-binding transcriptional ArsR family regulator
MDNQLRVAYENVAMQPAGMARMRPHTTAKEARRPPAKKFVDTDAMLDNARNASDFLKALSHEGRLAILCLLIDGEKSVGEIEELLNLRQAAVSQQLARLRADNLVKVRRDGKNVHYSIARPEVLEIMSALYRAFCR